MRVLVFCLLICSFAEARKSKPSIVTTLTGVVEACHDGDTCRVRANGKAIKVRFSGIDAPELAQPAGRGAQRFTQNLLVGKTVDLKCEGKSYKRTVCTVFLKGQDVNREIVQAGWAFESPRFSHGAYADVEKSARALRLGLWEGEDLRSPHCFRHKKDKRCRLNVQFMP